MNRLNGTDDRKKKTKRNCVYDVNCWKDGDFGGESML